MGKVIFIIVDLFYKIQNKYWYFFIAWTITQSFNAVSKLLESAWGESSGERLLYSKFKCQNLVWHLTFSMFSRKQMCQPCSCLEHVHLPLCLLCRRFSVFQILLYLCCHLILWLKHFHAWLLCPARRVVTHAKVGAWPDHPSGRVRADAWM